MWNTLLLKIPAQKLYQIILYDITQFIEANKASFSLFRDTPKRSSSRVACRIQELDVEANILKY